MVVKNNNKSETIQVEKSQAQDVTTVVTYAACQVCGCRRHTPLLYKTIPLEPTTDLTELAKIISQSQRRHTERCMSCGDLTRVQIVKTTKVTIGKMDMSTIDVYEVSQQHLWKNDRLNLRLYKP